MVTGGTSAHTVPWLQVLAYLVYSLLTKQLGCRGVYFVSSRMMFRLLMYPCFKSWVLDTSGEGKDGNILWSWVEKKQAFSAAV